jgi:PAS domain S-box-containing protein
VRPRHIAPVALVLGLTIAGFLVARLLAEQDARRDSEHRAEVAAAQIRERVTQGASLTESLRRFMLDTSGTGVSSDEFARNALRWLSPAGFPSAAWVERVPDSRSAAYRRRIGQPIVTPDERHKVVPAGSQPFYLPATLVSGFDPMAVPGIDLSREPGIGRALTRATGLDRTAATPVARLGPGTRGLFLVAPAPNLIDEVLRPGYVVVFVSDRTLRAAARETPALQVTTAGAPAKAAGGKTVRGSFVSAGQRFDVVVPRRSVEGAAAALPWIILLAGIVLAGLAAALGVNAARRAKAQDELDRLFNVSPDLIVVADFEGHYTRVNPAVEAVLGYTQEEFVGRPYADFFHPDDRERTLAEAAAVMAGQATLSFEHRFLAKDGSYRVLDWTATPVVEERAMYGVARDVTDRREAEAEVERLADEQAALRRVATLVAREASQAEIFSAIAEGIGQLLGTEEIRMLRYEDERTALVVASSGRARDVLTIGSRQLLGGEDAASRVFRTGRPARFDDYGAASGPIADAVRPIVRGVVATPIVVEGRLWGAMITATRRDEPLPPETESRLGQFTELMATAIANTESRARAERLTDEQAGLRRVATLVAKESPPAELFAKVAEEVANVIGDVDCVLVRDEGDGTGGVVAAWGADMSATVRVGERVPVDGNSVVASVLSDGRPCRIDDYGATTGTTAERGREHGLRSAAGCPILVGGRVWGGMVVARYTDEPLPRDTEARITRFTDLVATAIANAEARAEVERLAEEQAALRRVATLVAEGPGPTAVFDAVAGEMEALLGADQVALNRFESGAEIVVLAHRGLDVARTPVGSRVSLEGESVTATVRRTGRPARMENYEGVAGALAELARDTGLRASVGAPIVVEGRLWGIITASWKGEESPATDIEQRMVRFAELLDTAIANAEARTEVERLVEEQAALRRVATLVAQGGSPTSVLDAAAAEMERLLGAHGVTLCRYEPGEEVTVVAHRGTGAERLRAGTRMGHRGQNVTSMVRRTRRPARLEHYEDTKGAIGELVKELGVRASVAAPIIVEGRLWGVTIANWQGEVLPPPETEERMSQFAELLDTAIANADTRDQLTASRARLVTAADEARRRVVRDLHDGAQQRLVHAIVTLKLAQRALRDEGGKAEPLIGEALQQAERGNAELRELAHGILPAILTRGGLRAGISTLVTRLEIPVQVEVPGERLPTEVEASAYFIVAEALTNVVKHSHAASAEVRATVEDGVLRVEVRDDGVGGADSQGHGLVGIGDRATALGGRLRIESPGGGGTVVAATLPLSAG